jgi:para-nitrobenzyl esterase
MAPVSDTHASRTTITLSTGVVSGTAADGIRRFLGIPYAAPPFGALRFALPVPVEPWTGVRDATTFGPTAPQDPYFGAIGELLSSVEIPGEDILTVNVWAPAEVPAEGLPVMVWIHGGALERGTAALSIYDGTTFARDGVVFVSVNYRVGSEGFSVLEDAPRNLGLSDAALGLAWVAREIAAFGGDPARITIVGESAGGALVAALLVRPDTAPLVAGAVIESGPLEAESPERAARVTRALAKAMGVPPTAEAFRALTPRQLLNARRAQSRGGSPLSGGAGFTLAIDPASLPVSPHVGLVDVAVPLIIGSNTDEYRLWFPPAALAKIGRLQLLAGRVALRIPGRTIAEYRRALPGASTGEVLGQVATDRLLRGHAVRVAQRRTSPTYVYEFAWPSPIRDLRAAHALEIGFVFDNGTDADSLRLAGPDTPQSLADRMHGDWVRFIVTGDPGWPAFDEQRLVQLFDTESRVEPLPRAAAVDALPL